MIFVGKREIKRDCGISMVYTCYQSQRSIGAERGGGRGEGETGHRLGVEDEACKRSMKWRNITLAVLRCTINATDRKSKPGRTLESFILSGGDSQQ